MKVPMMPNKYLQSIRKRYIKHQVLVLLVVIVALGTGLRLYNLGNNSFVADEFLDINSSYGYSQTGTWKAWDFNYEIPATQNINDARDERAAVYKWQVAQVFKVLPPTETNARLISVLWGIISMLLIFAVTHYFTKSKATALLATFLFALSVSAIIFDRRLRMYAMFLPVYLALATSLYALLEHEYQGKLRVVKMIWQKYGVNILFIIPTLALGYLSFLTHQITLTIVPVVGVYLLAMSIILWREGSRKNKYSVLTALGLLGLLVVIVTGLWSKVSYLFVFFDNHYSYVGYVFGDFAQPLMGMLLVVVGARAMIRSRATRKQGVWLAVSLGVPLAMAIWLWHRNAGPQYIFFAQSFTFILAAAGVNWLRVTLMAKFSNTQKVSLVVVLLAALLLPNYLYFQEENNTYHETSSGGNPNYRKVFTYFKKQYEPGEVLITRNFRNYYWTGAQVPVYDFGGELSERNLSIADIQAIQAKHPKGWIILSENDLDYIKGDAKDYIEQNLLHVSSSNIRGAIEAYRWGS
jgi:hypothetical protein